MSTATGTFDITLVPGPLELDGRAGRFDFSKTWSGDLQGTSTGVMLSAGNPGAGEAGYVALEAFDGSVGSVPGGFAFSQVGSMTAGKTTLTYQVVSGSGTGALEGIAGALTLEVVNDVHTYYFAYSLPD